MRNETLMTIRFALRIRIDTLAERLRFWSEESDDASARVTEETRKELEETQVAYDAVVRFQDTGVWPEDDRDKNGCS
ncbi:hypothetical protein [Paenibacillus sp. YN15]|uniref:hypothetical protein n=1 Tax=Paenibacillus sp. YN15 TaxID=1742774 RepID=UPI000DCBFD76|nr:hypothetical protein [Paenibacillus sp. YN15]RAU96793.1 hypothetical protein DQG13_19745 [Paenibacillus sp. YN15]